MSSSIISKEITQAVLMELFLFNPDTGVFLWKNGQRAGLPAGSTDSKGYRQIIVHKKLRQAHRLAWMYVYGAWPKGVIDHINGRRDDNRIVNLRDVTQSENMHNRQKTRGCYLNKHGRWVAYIRVNSVKIHLGTFPTEADAYKQYLYAKKTMHPTAPINSKVQAIMQR
jgi:hypothetical protein